LKTILVTGGAGFIGSHACKALASAGYLPVTVDNLERGHEQAVKWGPLERADIRDEHTIRGVFAHWRPEAVLHFAAYAYVGESTTEPLKYYQTNVGGTSSLLKACITSGCNRVVFSSSCATYGIPATLPIAENHPQQPINPYGFTKLVVERMLRDADSAHGIKHVTLRYFNAAGADPDGELGERHDPETHLIPLALLAALGRRSSIKVFGNDYPTADGTCVRDYVHVSDLADAHVAALEWLFREKTSDSFNLGTGQGYSVAQVVQETEEITGKNITVELSARRPGDPPTLISDATKATRLLGWKPQFPTVKEQIRHAWHWFREF
jgi:UDP-arabinose 4-epimerase